ncbi:hypothetical protein TWF481_002174 [Arthrobotrys musiformis]|uniref:Uncharacterized protein n=1 Tax=Arthrobotrys musiformis TaxID=47236 RepID=A0AAV9VSI2_9PEZI
MAAAVAQLQSQIEAVLSDFAISDRIKEIKEAGDVRYTVPVKIEIKADATITLNKEKSTVSDKTEAPTVLEGGSVSTFKIAQGDELKYTLTSGDFTADFKIEFEVDDSAPKLKLSDELEADDVPVGFEITKTKIKTEIEIEREVEIEKKWTKGKRPERKIASKGKDEAEAGPHELSTKSESEFGQKTDGSKSKKETETEIKSKSVEVEYIIY